MLWHGIYEKMVRMLCSCAGLDIFLGWLYFSFSLCLIPFKFFVAISGCGCDIYGVCVLALMRISSSSMIIFVALIFGTPGCTPQWRVRTGLGMANGV